MNYLVFDTETTGVPKNYKAPMNDFNNWPRVIQLAWALYSEDGEYLDGRKDLILPDGWEVPNEKFWIDNGFSNEQNINEGVCIKGALDMFIEQINEGADVVIAHNLNFDFNILGCEMLRANVRAERKLQKFCTMISAVDLCQLPGKFGFKWPKLIELHQKLFGEGFDGAHDALADVKACGRCFFEMKRREIKFIAQ